MNKQDKAQFIQEIHTDLEKVEWAFLFDYRGLKVEQVNALRRKVRGANSNYRVIKNTLAKLAVKETLLEGLSDSFNGPIAIAWTKEDPIALAKVMMEFAKENKELQFKSGIVSGKLINSNEFAELSRLPGKQELLARLVYVLNSPIRGFVTALNEIITKFVRVLGQIQKQKES